MNLQRIRLVNTIILFLLIHGLSVKIQTQTYTSTDTSVVSKTSDSTAVVPEKTKSDLEGPVKYTAEKISFSMDGKRTHLEGNVKIEYQTMNLEAGKVTIDWNNNLMRATGIIDSTDSLGNPIYKDLPVFKEKGNEPIHGEDLEFNFKTQRGKVYSGKTNMHPGYYTGENIKKIGKKTLLVEEGYFTSCDSSENPHFYFKSSKMRIIMHKRAVAKPIILFIEDIPIIGIPFGVFPMERGRRSGLIIPTFGSSSYGGKSLRNMGFYWAASDYWDATFLANFYERTGTAYEGEIRYKKRYALNGNVDWRYAPKDVTTGEKRERWSVNFRHNQTINETTNFNASGSFTSDRSFLKDYSHYQQDRLNQVLRTNATFSKRWPSSKNSLTANIDRTENLQNGNLDYTFPGLAFTHTRTNIFSYDPKGGGKRKWYHDLYYNYNSNFVAKGSRKLQTVDTTSYYLRQTQTGWRHNINLSFNTKIFKHLKYNQSIKFDELWVPKYLDYTFIDSLNTTFPDTIKKFRARHTFSTSIGASTTIYGLFETPFLPVKIIRHKMDPRISFSFSPNFTEPKYGYVQTFRDTTGKIIRGDRFAGNPFGGTSSSESRSMNIAVNNLFQGKIIKNGEEKKIDLFYLNFSTAHNFIADSLKWNNLSSNFRAKATKDFNINISTTHTFYKPKSDGTGRKNEYVWSDGFALPRLLQLQLNADIHLKPPKRKEDDKTKKDTTMVEDTTDVFDITKDPIKEGLRKFDLPWDLTTRFSYSLNRNDIHNTTKRFDANIAARIEITKNWRIQYTASIDLIKKQLSYQSFNIYRDLHCWEMSFSWGPNPNGYSFFTFEIHVKEPILRDIKLTKSSGSQRVF